MKLMLWTWQSAEEGRIFSARSSDGLVYSLWSLLPSFCNYAIDTSSSFKLLQSSLCATLRQEPDLRGIICSSLQVYLMPLFLKLRFVDDCISYLLIAFYFCLFYWHLDSYPTE